MPKLTAIFFTAYMLAVMWTFRAHGQAPDEPVVAPSQSLPRVELPADEPTYRLPAVTGGMTMSVGAVIAIVGAARWARVEKPLPASRSERVRLGLGSVGLLAYSQLGLSVLAVPELVSCAVNSNS